MNSGHSPDFNDPNLHFPLNPHVPSFVLVPSGKHLHIYGKSPCLMGKLTISMAMFNSFLYVYQRLIPLICFIKSHIFPHVPSFSLVIPLIWFIKSHIFPGETRPFTTFLPQGTATGVGAEGLAAWAAVAGITSTWELPGSKLWMGAWTMDYR